MLGAEAEPHSSIGRALTLGTEPKAWKWAASCCTASSRRAASAYSPRSTARCSWSASEPYLLANISTLIRPHHGKRPMTTVHWKRCSGITSCAAQRLQLAL